MLVTGDEASWAYSGYLEAGHEAPLQADDVESATVFAHFVSCVVSATEYVNMLLAVLVSDAEKRTDQLTAWEDFNLLT